VERDVRCKKIVKKNGCQISKNLKKCCFACGKHGFPDAMSGGCRADIQVRASFGSTVFYSFFVLIGKW